MRSKSQIQQPRHPRLIKEHTTKMVPGAFFKYVGKSPLLAHYTQGVLIHRLNPLLQMSQQPADGIVVVEGVPVGPYTVWLNQEEIEPMTRLEYAVALRLWQEAHPEPPKNNGTKP